MDKGYIDMMLEGCIDNDSKVDGIEQKNFIVSEVGIPALLEQLAEECAELAHAALKCARVIRQENPTPVTQSQAASAVIAEFTDLMVVCDVLGLEEDGKAAFGKMSRWENRLKKAKM